MHIFDSITVNYLDVNISKTTQQHSIYIRNKEAIVVSAEEGVLRDPGCVKVCGGTTRRGATNWAYSGSRDVWVTVDISDCGFVATPTLTTSIEGGDGHWTTTGNSAVFNLSASSFTMWLRHPHTSSYARTYHWNVEWIAIGYTC